MRPQDFPYVTLRALIQDSDYVNSQLVKKVAGYGRSRDLARLTSCTSLFRLAMHGLDEMKFLRQVEAIFKKNSIFSDAGTCAENALKSFHSAERQCAETNSLLEFFYANRGLLCPDIRYWMTRCEAFIERVLGDFKTFLDELPQLIRLTSGATSTSNREHSLPQLKIKNTIFCTEGAASYVRALYRYFGAEPPNIKLVNWVRVLTVPKNWKTDRTIGCEPEGNLPLQLAFDTYVKRRLKKFGIDLHSQLRNQDLAIRGSIEDDLSTLDGKAASDTVAYNAVAWLFPPEWFDFLNRVRTPAYKVGGKGEVLPYHKFSSMGNGSTFCIETLLFASVCYAVGAPEFSVYGDDIICSRAYTEEVVLLLRFLGIQINEDKTFTSGPFRESCGVDAYEGKNITPVYMRYVDGRKATMCHCVNSFLRIASPGGNLCQLMMDVIHEFKLPLIPYDGDSCSGVWITPELAQEMGRLKYLRKSFGNFSEHTFRYKGYKPKTRMRPFRYFRGYYLWFLAKSNQVRFPEVFVDFRVGPIVKADIEPQDATVTSACTLYQHTYVRKWVGYIKPRTFPLHLYWWSNLIEREFPL